MNISIILPAYQEAENLNKILPTIKDVLNNAHLSYEVLVIDTMEELDNTKQICREFDAKYINREGGNMYGDAIRTGFKYCQGDFTLVMDADGSHNPKDIIRLYDEINSKKYNLVIGSRYCKGGKTDNSFILKAMSWALNFTYRVFFGLLKIKDISNSFRIYRTEDIKQLKLECSNFDIVEEILIKLNYLIDNFKVSEIPVHFSKRDKGESKRDLMKFIFSYLTTMKRLKDIKSNIVK